MEEVGRLMMIDCRAKCPQRATYDSLGTGWWDEVTYTHASICTQHTRKHNEVKDLRQTSRGHLRELPLITD